MDLASGPGTNPASAKGHAGAVLIPAASCPEQTGEDETSAVFGVSEQLEYSTWRYGYRVCTTSRSGQFYGDAGSLLLCCSISRAPRPFWTPKQAGFRPDCGTDPSDSRLR